MPGILYVVATPIGNLEDLTFRAINILKSVSWIACEDTRQTIKILNHVGFRQRLERYDEHTHERASQKILDSLKRGEDVALVTDAGTPAISDPGNRLVQAVGAAGLKVVPVPGPSSLTAALSVSGFSSGEVTFLGFLPKRDGRAKTGLQGALGLGRTLVLFESPFRIRKTLEWLAGMAPERPLVLCRELTKLHEEIVRGSVAEVFAALKDRTPKGEYVIVVGPDE